MPLIIQSLTPEGHFRAGVKHGPTPTEWPEGAFTEKELASLHADPRLSISQADTESQPDTRPKEQPEVQLEEQAKEQARPEKATTTKKK